MAIILSLSSSIYLFSRSNIDKNDFLDLPKSITKGTITVGLALLKLGHWFGKEGQKQKTRKKLGLSYFNNDKN